MYSFALEPRSATLSCPALWMNKDEYTCWSTQVEDTELRWMASGLFDRQLYPSIGPPLEAV